METETINQCLKCHKNDVEIDSMGRHETGDEENECYGDTIKICADCFNMGFIILNEYDRFGLLIGIGTETRPCHCKKAYVYSNKQ